LTTHPRVIFFYNVAADEFTYSGAVISACDKGGQWKEALEVFEAMKEDNVPPDTRTYNALIRTAGGQWKEALRWFEDMKEDNVMPDVITYNTKTKSHPRKYQIHGHIPIKHFHAILTKTMSTEWKFWERTHNQNTTSEISREQYIGSAHDSTFLNKSPIKDIIQWDRKIAHMRYLPDTFKARLPKHNGDTKSKNDTNKEQYMYHNA
jgi:pentatricopeptide repeat protein